MGAREIPDFGPNAGISDFKNDLEPVPGGGAGGPEALGAWGGTYRQPRRRHQRHGNHSRGVHCSPVALLIQPYCAPFGKWPTGGGNTACGRVAVCLRIAADALCIPTAPYGYRPITDRLQRGADARGRQGAWVWA